MEELDFYKIGKEMKRLRREHSFYAGAGSRRPGLHRRFYQQYRK